MARSPSCALLAVLLWVWPLPASGQTFTGDGPLATDPFPLPAGLLIIELDHEGTGEFRANLFDGTGGIMEELADVAGAFAGSRAIQVPAGDTTCWTSPPRGSGGCPALSVRPLPARR